VVGGAGTYVHSLDGQKVRLLVQPELEAGLEYRSLLIVPANSAGRTSGSSSSTSWQGPACG